MKECVFCRIVKGEKKNIVYENGNFISFYDINQDVKGHALVISKKHFKTTLDLPSSLGTEFLDCIKKTALKIMKEVKAEGFNVINNNFSAAGQFVEHVHFHIFPRKSDDGLHGTYLA